MVVLHGHDEESVKCWICTRHARGFGHADTRFAGSDPRCYPLDWVFCSRRCQDLFHNMYSNWRRDLPDQTKRSGGAMIDATEIELASMRSCLMAFGEVASEIGFEKALASYTEDEALLVIRAIVTCWTDSMAKHHEASKYPTLRGTTATPDPLASLTDDLPWKTSGGNQR